MNLIPWRKRGEDNGSSHPVRLFRRQMDRLFEDFFGDWTPLRGAGGFVPRLDVSESDKEVVVSAELPGMIEKDVEVTFAGGRLLISGEKKSESEKDREGYHLVERSYGSFSRSVELGDGVDPEKAVASYRNGVLEIKVPKTEAGKPRKIDIKGE